MRVLILGASGFVGSHLARALYSTGMAQNKAGHALAPITELVLADARPVYLAGPSPVGVPVTQAQGDICDPAFMAQLFEREFDTIFHLAAALTLDAEMDFARGMAVNVHALMSLLEHCRAQQKPARFLFASSISAFGGTLPPTVDDHVAQTPQTSYGTHKSIAELLINDYSRRGFVDGRVLRLPVVVTHPGPPGTSVSDRLAALIREPLNGRDVVCPLAPDTEFPVASVQRIVAALLRLQSLPTSAFGRTRAMNFPALTTTPAAVAKAVANSARHPNQKVKGNIIWQADEKIQTIVQGWPRVFASEAALRHGIQNDGTIEAVVAAYLGGMDVVAA